METVLVAPSAPVAMMVNVWLPASSEDVSMLTGRMPEIEELSAFNGYLHTNYQNISPPKQPGRETYMVYKLLHPEDMTGRGLLDPC